MICLADNDVVLKLAALDLLQEGFEVIGTSERDVRVLRTFKYLLDGKRETLSAQFTVPGYMRAYTFTGKAITLPGTPIPADIAALTGVDSIDDGEARLFECACRHPDCVVATGDKQSLRALANAADCQSVYDRLVGRVICFEQILSRLIKAHGYDRVRDSACSVPESDGVLKKIFVQGIQTAEIIATTTLSGVVSEMWTSAGPLLVAT